MSDEALEAAEFVAAGGEAGVAAQQAEAPQQTETVAASDELLEKMFGGLTDGEPEKPAEAKTEEATESEEETEEAEPEFDDLSDARPWTPERVKNAAAQLRADRQAIAARFSKLDAREKKFTKKLNEFKTEKHQVGLISQRVMTDLETCRTGSPEQAAAALGRLVQRDPYSFYESLSLAMLGKAPQQAKESAVIQELKSEISELKNELKQGKQQQTDAQFNAQVRHQIRGVMASPEEWPQIAAKAKESPAQIALEFEQIYVQQSEAAGRWLDVETVADRIERTLRRKLMPSHRAKQNGATGSGPDRDQETRALANPETAQSPPRSLSPNQSAVSGGARRVPTEDEMAAEFARSAPPEFFQQFGV